MKVIKKYGAPTAETIGNINDFYVDLDTNNVYRCTNIKTIGEEWGGVTLYASGLDNTVYTWETCGGGSSGPALFSIPVLDEFDITWDGSTEGRDTLTMFYKNSDPTNCNVYYKIAEPMNPYSFVGARMYEKGSEYSTLYDTLSSLKFSNGTAACFASGSSSDPMIISCVELNGVFYNGSYNSSWTFEATSPGLYVGAGYWNPDDPVERFVKTGPYNPIEIR